LKLHPHSQQLFLSCVLPSSRITLPSTIPLRHYVNIMVLVVVRVGRCRVCSFFLQIDVESSVWSTMIERSIANGNVSTSMEVGKGITRWQYLEYSKRSSITYCAIVNGDTAAVLKSSSLIVKRSPNQSIWCSFSKPVYFEIHVVVR
jgi:hypothetical protein